MLEEIGLWEHRNTPCLKLSGGMKRLVILAMAIAPEVDAVFLDEPTAGLDPVNRVKVWGLINRLAREGVHILVTSHEMEEVEERAEEVVMINRGKVVAQGPPEKLIAEVSSLVRIEVTLSRAEAYKELVKALEGLDGVEGVYNLGSTALVYVNSHEVMDIVERISEVAPSSGLKIGKCGLRDVFLRHAL
ncbi:MAG: hypothetical protein DRJ35_00215 [Thermoprotei archaeon]|nr:MAG: hypothetical protein DRJ35_00215 [Thermoprotei archaeon]